MSARALALRHSCATGQHADAVELRGGGVFAVGTYQLREQGVRDGSIQLYHASSGDEALSLRLLHTAQLPGAGVFDLKWSADRRLLAAATAAGQPPLLFRCDDSDKLEQQTAAATDDAAPSDLVCLSVAWSPLVGDQLAASYNHGRLAVYQATPSGLHELAAWQPHGDAEAWTVAFDAGAAARLYSGADDCTFRAWDLRIDERSASAHTTKRTDMGVTTVAPHPDGLRVAVGGYDESVSVWDVRHMRAPLSTLPGLGGGVWRIKYHPLDPACVLVAAMRGGFHLVDCTDPARPAIAATHLHPHTSEGLSYGADWIVPVDQPNTLGIAACASFYDSLLTLVEATR